MSAPEGACPSCGEEVMPGKTGYPSGAEVWMCPSCKTVLGVTDSPQPTPVGESSEERCPACGQDVFAGKVAFPSGTEVWTCDMCGVILGLSASAESADGEDDQMYCPDCGESAPSGAEFCPSCGASLAGDACPSCGADIEADASFCTNCGHEL